MTKFASLAADLLRFVDRLGSIKTLYIGLTFILASYAISNGIKFIGNDVIATNALFLVLAMSNVCIGLYVRIFSWYGDLFFIFAVYNLIDELMSTGCEINSLEYIGAVVTIIYIYKTRKKCPLFY